MHNPFICVVILLNLQFCCAFLRKPVFKKPIIQQNVATMVGKLPALNFQHDTITVAGIIKIVVFNISNKINCIGSALAAYTWVQLWIGLTSNNFVSPLLSRKVIHWSVNLFDFEQSINNTYDI